MALRDAFLVLALVLATACTVEETRQWIVSSPVAGVDGVECRVLAGGCDGTEVLHTTTFCATGGAGAAPSGFVDGQRYGYDCRATDCCDRDVAQGCTEVVHPPAGDVRVVMDRALDPACAVCTSPCPGSVPQEDGGVSEDGGPGADARRLDGDVVGPTSCVPGMLPACPPGSLCVDGPAPGDGRCALTCTAGSACAADEECKWLPEGRVCWYSGPGAASDQCVIHADCGQGQACTSAADAGGLEVSFCARVLCTSDADCIADLAGKAQVCVDLDGINRCLSRCVIAPCLSHLTCALRSTVPSGAQVNVCAP